MKTGPRKSAVVKYRASRSDSAEEGGGAPTTGGSAVIPPALTFLFALLVRRCRSRFQLLLDAADVLRVPKELLEQAPFALTGGTAERRRLLVGHVEDDRLRRRDRSLAQFGDGVRVDAGRHVLVAGAEPTLLRPHLRGRRGREIVHERSDRRSVTEGDEEVSRDLDAVRSRPVVGRRELEDVEARYRLRLRRREDDAADEVGLEHHRCLRRCPERVGDGFVEAVLERAGATARDVAGVA